MPNRTPVPPSRLVQDLLCLRGEPFSIEEYPYLHQIYNTKATEVGLWTARQVSKSTFLASDAVLHAIAEPNDRQVIVSPLQEQAYVFATERLRDFIHDSPIIKHNFFSGPSVIDQMLRKQFNNGHLITLGYAQRTADRLRGKSASRVKYDESIRGSGCVASPLGPRKIKDLEVGDPVWAFDALEQEITCTTVQHLYDHGIRQVWRVTLEDGTVLDCTSGTRVCGPNGWVYLHEVIDYAMVRRSQDSGKLQGPPELRATPVSAGDDAGGRVLFRRPIPDQPRDSTGGLCGPPVSDTGPLRKHAPEAETESGVGDDFLFFCDADLPSFRVFADPLLPSGPVEPIPDEEDGDAAVARRSGLDGDRVLVYGRRVPWELAYRDYLDTRFFESRERASGLVVVLERDRNGGATHGDPRRNEMVPSDDPRLFPALYREGEALYPFLDAVQNGDRTLTDADLCLLRDRIPGQEQPDGNAIPLLRGRDLPGRMAAMDEGGMGSQHLARREGANAADQECPESGTAGFDDTRAAGAYPPAAGGLDRREPGVPTGLEAGVSPQQERGPGVRGETAPRASRLLSTQEVGPRAARENARTDAAAPAAGGCQGEGAQPTAVLAGAEPRQSSGTTGAPECETPDGGGQRRETETPVGRRDRLDSSVECLLEDSPGDLHQEPDLRGPSVASQLHQTSVPGVQESCGGEGTQKPRKTGQRIVSIEFLGYDRVYDIETAEHHNFFANGVLVHNCQDILPDVIPVVNEMTFRAPDPSIWYCGTPKSMTNHMEAMRARSTGCEWAVKCHHAGCGHWNHTWDERNIGDLGVICAKCGKPINTNRGQWVARRELDTYKGKEARVNMVSYRIPQLIVKPVMDIPSKWAELLVKHRKYPEYQFRNEVLGLPAESGENPVTLDQVLACCSPDRENRPPTRRDSISHPLVMGVDWAFTADKSYTFVVIGGWDPFPHRFQVYYAKRFTGNEADSIWQISEIVRLFRECRIQLIGADWGAGHVQNIAIANKVGEECLAQLWHTRMHAIGAQRAKWESKTRKWHLARTRVLTDTFESIKRTQCVFPRSSECQELVDDILAVVLEYREASNQVFYTHVEPDDGLHALTFAMLAGELLLRGDFSGHAGSESVGGIDPGITDEYEFDGEDAGDILVPHHMY